MRQLILTIIVPTYNPRPEYFLGCLKSLANISNKLVEVIIVDDGSKKNVSLMVEKYGKKIHNLTYIRQSNRGVSEARNSAIPLSKGKYITFVDSDDEVIASEIDSLCSTLEKEKTDLIISDHINKECEKNRIVKLRNIRANNAKSKLICAKIPSAPWSKIYKKEIIQKYNISFPKNIRIGEDLVFVYTFLKRAHTIKHHHKPFYIYNINNTGAMSNGKIRGDVVLALEKIGNNDKNMRARKFYEALYSQNDLRISKEKYLNNAMLFNFLLKSSFGMKTKIKTLRMYVRRKRYDIYLRCYLEKNLGDDLFMLCVAERYKNNRILCLSTQKYDKKNIPKNVSVKHITRFEYYMSLLLTKINNGFDINKKAANQSSIVVQVGGSMFIEDSNNPQSGERLKKEYDFMANKESYILGSNIGPCVTNEYLSHLRDIIRKSTYTCVRDKKSYSLIKDIPNTAYAPDIIFSFKLHDMKSKIPRKHKKTAIVSVINPAAKIRQIPQNCEPKTYYSQMAKIINELDSLGYDISLMSFCKNEGDEDAIWSILNNDSLLIDGKKIKVVLYDGDIKNALNAIEMCDLIIGSRFHANVLGIIMGKNIIPIAYNEKTTNMLRDLKFNGLVLDMQSLNRINDKTIKDNLNNKAILANIDKRAERHFSALDSRIVGYNKNEQV